jgi:hypothetical protein
MVSNRHENLQESVGSSNTGKPEIYTYYRNFVAK